VQSKKRICLLTNSVMCGIIDTRRLYLSTYNSQPRRLVSSTNIRINWLAVIFERDSMAWSWKKDSGIYEIVNKINGHRYVGSALVIQKRFNEHKCALRSGREHSSHLQNAWNKYGESAFEFIPIVRVPVPSLLRYEQIFLDEEFGEYNTCTSAWSTIGVRPSDATRSKQSIAKIGNSNAKGNRGKKRSEEFKNNLRLLYTGGHLSEEHKLKISLAHRLRSVNGQHKGGRKPKKKEED
jgi:group I intron endonuclease